MPDANRRMIAAVKHYDLSWTVLGGVIAVPCNPQTALAGLNPLSRGPGLRVGALIVALMARSRDDEDP
jgi:hypothetical protein